MCREINYGVNEMWDLFDESYDYPQNIAEDGIPEDTLYNYVSSTLLNGYINYVEPILAVMVERYGTEDEVSNYQTDIDIFNKIYHSNFSNLRDDVLIIAKTDSFYWFFWYDKDCSDCSIGRFTKNKCSEIDLIKYFKNMIKSHEYFTSGKMHTLKLQGWISG